ncbi:MAG: DUF7305 domain-containing protein [Phycisphaerales bacterium]
MKPRVPRTARASKRRGVAMLLVLVALATATVLSASYLAARQAAPALGANAEIASNARWAAVSGANLGVAILETSYTLDPDDSKQLISGQIFGVGGADALVTSDTGDAANADDARLILSSLGSADGLGAVDQRVLLRRRTNKVTEALDPFMREFAVFATDRLRIQNSSLIAPWPGSERGPTHFIANIGVGFGPSGMLATSGAGSLVNTRLIVDQDATSSLRTVAASGTFGGGLETELQFPTASARVPTALSSIGGGPTVITWNAGSTYTSTRPDYNDIYVTAGCTFIFDEDVSPDYSVNDLTVAGGSTLRIKGNVRILVRDDINVYDRANIEMFDKESSVEFYVLDDLSIDNAVFGLPIAVAMNTSRTHESISGAFDASDIRVFLIDADGGGQGGQSVTIEGGAIVIADIHAPAADVDLREASTILGRISGRDVLVRNASYVFYDHALNPGAGLSDPYGPLYDSDRYDTLRDALASFSNAAGLDTLLTHVEDEFDAAGVDPDPDEPGPDTVTDPDPRMNAKIVIVPMRRGSARAIEAGSFGSISDSVIPVAGDTLLARSISGVEGVLRAAAAITGGRDDDAAPDDEEEESKGVLANVLEGLLGGGN